MIDVLNRGIGGQEAPSELSRFEPDVLAELPALVIWQVGTNAVFRKKSSISSEVVVCALRPACDGLRICRSMW